MTDFHGSMDHPVYDWDSSTATVSSHKRPHDYYDNGDPYGAKRPRVVENHWNGELLPQPHMQHLVQSPQFQHQQPQPQHVQHFNYPGSEMPAPYPYYDNPYPQQSAPNNGVPHPYPPPSGYSPPAVPPYAVPGAPAVHPIPTIPAKPINGYAGSVEQHTAPMTALTSSELLSPSLDDQKVFKEVSTSLSIDGGGKITIGELKRRIVAPEYMDFMQIARLTKHSKSTFRDFQRSFIKTGFDPVVNEGMSRASGILASLLEGDAVILARDFTKILSSELSIAPLVESLIAAAGDRFEVLVAKTPIIREHLSSLLAHLKSVGRDPSELSARERIRKIDPSVKNFTLATHGFGPLATVAVIESMTTLLSAIEKIRSDQIKGMANSSRLSISFSSLDDSGLGNSFDENSSPSPPPRLFAKSSTSDIDLVSLSASGDEVVYTTAPPRITHDSPDLVNVTIGELRRRAHGPEKFTVSLINNYMRKGKKSNTHNDLRRSLADQGITIPSLKGLTPNSWSSLFESEATALAAQTSHFLSFVGQTEEMGNRAASMPDTIAWTRYLAGTLQGVMSRVGSEPGQGTVESEADTNVLRFALISHHFGHSFYASVMQWLQNIL